MTHGPNATQPLRERPAAERERLADDLLERLDAPMAALGVAFLLLVVAETFIAPGGGVGAVLQAASWAIVAAFVGEFVVRLYLAPSRAAFLRRNWWQLIFLALPFLRVLRVLRALRLLRFARAGRIISSALRATRTARRRLTGRVAWLATVTAIVVLASSQLLYELGGMDSYAEALYHAGMATITGEPTGVGGIGKLLDVVLGGYSVVVFATLAGSVGAYLVEQGHAETAATSPPERDGEDPGAPSAHTMESETPRDPG